MTKHLILYLLLFISFYIGVAQTPQAIKIDHLPDIVEELNCVGIDKDTIWIGSNRGLVKLYNDKIEHFYDKNDPSKFTVNNIHIDSTGTKWLGTYRSSLIKFQGSIDDPEISFRPYINDEYQLVSSFSFHDNQAFIGTSNGIIVRYDMEKDTFHLVKNEFIGEIYDIHKDENGILWVCTITGLYSMKKEGKWEKLPYFSIASHIFEADGKLWVIGRNAQNQTKVLFLEEQDIYVFAFKVKKKIWNELIVRGIGDEYLKFNDITFDENNNMWIATDGGIVIFNPKTDEHKSFSHEENEKFDIKSVKSIGIQNNNLIWLITKDNQLYKLDFKNQIIEK